MDNWLSTRINFLDKNFTDFIGEINASQFSAQTAISSLHFVRFHQSDDRIVLARSGILKVR